MKPIYTIVIVIIVAAAAFFGGMKYQQMQRSASAQQFAAGGAQGQYGFRRNGTGGRVLGQIVSQDANSITVKMPDGSSKIVNISSSTNISKSATASASDLKSGETVSAFGSTNSDGSVTAQIIQLNPQMRAGGRPQQQ